MQITKALENAVILLTAGHSYNVGGILLTAIGTLQIRVSGSTVKGKLKNLTKGFCISELEDIKREFTFMLDASHIFKDFMRDKRVIYSLIYDYGMGGILICREVEGKITWNADILIP